MACYHVVLTFYGLWYEEVMSHGLEGLPRGSAQLLLHGPNNFWKVLQYQFAWQGRESAIQLLQVVTVASSNVKTKDRIFIVGITFDEIFFDRIEVEPVSLPYATSCHVAVEH